ncbi:nucleoside diphosphate-linked moiety X motif 17-like [Patiria miniata]|uniref:m7GpppN-mRNA hydrolase NUDT17 n=1 Tax=Patiria miniata TaxID=46514 RepID=A0A914BQY9_PATMI|nr:nucleoside diphosphate-linked moiety X motif 17-like [Patiria miniata]
MATSHCRLLVFLRKSADAVPQKANFTQCILDYFGASGNTTSLSCSLDDNKLVVSQPNNTSDGIIMKHPPFCPLHNLQSDQAADIPESTLHRGIDVGVATLLWSSDRKLLLTRRAANLKTFPGVWVPPGGHVELNETLTEAGLRELMEETGLELKVEDCKETRTIALWESAYPPMLSHGLPKRHHVVIYQTVQVSEDHHALQQRLKLQVSEVGAAVWLSENIVHAIGFRGSDETDGGRLPDDMPESIRATVVHPDTQEQVQEDIPTSMLFETAPSIGQDTERISTGTKFAIEQWCRLHPKDS